MDYPNLSWPALIGILGKIPRDEPAWQELSRRLTDQARCVLRRQTYLGVGPEDIAHETLVKFFTDEKLLRQVAEHESPGAFLRTMQKHKAIALVRRSITNLKILQGVLAAKHGQQGTATSAQEDERLEFAKKAFDSLPAQDRRILHLKLRDDLSLTEIANKFNITFGAAGVRLFRCLKKLREACAAHALPR